MTEDMLPPLSWEAEAFKVGLYKHYKGTIYRAIGIARHSESLEEYVVYQTLDGQLMWVRPLKIFIEPVKIEGQFVPRFEFLEE